MLADFTIMIHDVSKPLGVRVKVHDNLRALHSAVTQQDNFIASHGGRKRKGKNRYKDTLAICQRFHMANSSIYAIVRFAPPHIGSGIVAHEMTHAAIGLWEIKNQFKVPLTCENDEWFAWILGELVRQTHVKFFEKGIYE